MTELPRHPDDDGLGVSAGEPLRGPRLRRVYLWWLVAGVAVAVMLVLHLTGVIGAESH